MNNAINVVGNRHRLTKSGNIFLLSTKTKQLSGNQGYNLGVLLIRNEDMCNNGEVIEIDWAKTFTSHQKRIDARTKEKITSLGDFKDDIMLFLKDETKKEKLSLEISTSESYLEMVRLEALKPEKVKDYIGWLENQVIALTGFNVKSLKHESKVVSDSDKIKDLEKQLALEKGKNKDASKSKAPTDDTELKGLQSEYEQLKGSKPDMRWKEPKLKEEISQLKTQLV